MTKRQGTGRQSAKNCRVGKKLKTAFFAPDKRNRAAEGFFLNRKTIRFVFAIVAVAAVYVGYCAATLPDIEKAVKNTRAPKVYILAADGSEIASYGAQYGRPVELKRLPAYVPQAVIATEDRRFYSHFGIDPRSVARALTVNIIKGRKAQGASTLTQQVAKNLFCLRKKRSGAKCRNCCCLSGWNTN